MADLPAGFKIDPKQSQEFGVPVAVNSATGKRIRLKSQDGPAAALTPGSESRTRVMLGFGPAVEAQRRMYAAERAKPDKLVNPLNEDWGAAVIDGLDDNVLAKWAGANTSALANKVGGQDYQEYDQAAKSFESAFLPILSGAAVTPTEAQRQVRANLPALGNTVEILQQKSKQRAMMINAAADLAGRPRPFPRIGTWDFKSGAPGAPGDGAGTAPKVRKYNPKTGRIE